VVERFCGWSDTAVNVLGHDMFLSIGPRYQRASAGGNELGEMSLLPQ
jgi:hypothetical protein